MRLYGKEFAAITLLGDGLKGVVAIFVGMLFGVEGFMLSIVALAAVVGHMYPVFFKFEGGKGVATSLGCYLALSPTLGLITILLWIALVVVFRYASLASLVACIAAPFVGLFFVRGCFVGLILIALLVIWRHRENIQRLRAGTESKFAANNTGVDLSDKK